MADHWDCNCETLRSALSTEIEKQGELALLDPELNQSAPDNLEQAS